MITFLYKRRPDDTFVIERQGNPYQVIDSDQPLYDQCVEEYPGDEALPDEPPPPPPPSPLGVQ